MRIQAALTAAAMNLKKLVKFGPVPQVGIGIPVLMATERLRVALPGLHRRRCVAEGQALIR